MTEELKPIIQVLTYATPKIIAAINIKTALLWSHYKKIQWNNSREYITIRIRRITGYKKAIR